MSKIIETTNIKGGLTIFNPEGVAYFVKLKGYWDLVSVQLTSIEVPNKAFNKIELPDCFVEVTDVQKDIHLVNKEAIIMAAHSPELKAYAILFKGGGQVNLNEKEFTKIHKAAK